MTLQNAVEKAERDAIVAMLRVHLGRARITRAAQALGITRKTLWVKMKRYQIDKLLETAQQRLAL